ncbi:MAG: C10 family peptidase, partial [Bacteroidales bacterium]|nr:C10 family peptidase [Bacteroidales bacterium]
YTETFNGEEVFHVYNLEPTGFVIVSAERSVEPLLAFSYESTCSQTDRHPSVEAVLKSYSEQIAYAIKNGQIASSHTNAEWEHYSATDFSARNMRTVAPLLITKWDQGKYFNSACPEDAHGKDGHVVVGCVATAIAQIFNYFRYPTQGTGSYGYDHPDYGHLEVNFAEQHYDYDYMPVKPTDYNENLARLLYNIGVSVDMNYGPNGSGMNNHKGAYTMRNYFGYSDEARYIFKDSLPTVIPDNIDNDTVIPDSIWNGILVNHLDRRIPLYYAGWGDYVYESGHAFVFDGYSDSTRYHINWGWGGSYDGFFTVSNLSPGGSNFRLAHEVIINATPKYENQSCEGYKEINFFEGTIEDGSGPLRDYAPESDCSWHITQYDSVSGYTVKIEKFDIDATDYIIIYAGDDEDAPIVATIFGEDEPNASYTVNSTSMLIKFVSDETASGDGWLISYAPIKPRYCNSLTSLTEMVDTISDGSNNWPYNNSTNCSWQIRPSSTSNFSFVFLELDTEYGKDFVKIMRNGRLYARFSGDTIPEPISFDAESVLVIFTSNGNRRAGGFKIAYSVGEPTSRHEIDMDDIAIYPNPATTEVIIEGNNLSHLTLYDITGRCIVESEIESDIHTINTSNLSGGTYIIKVIDKYGNCTTKKIEIR